MYSGLNYTLEENKRYITLAKELGYKGIFTSLNIKEGNDALFKEFKEISKMAGEYKMNLSCDISPAVFKKLNISSDLKEVERLGIKTMRVDFGFSCEKIAEFTKNNYGISIELNASTMSEDFIKELIKYEPDFEKLKACHNFYPRLNTGLSESSFLRKNKMLKNLDIEISAFIPSMEGKRGPFYDGLPTLEIHRNMRPGLAAKHLLALGTDNVIFGDAFASKSELLEVSMLKDHFVNLNILMINTNPSEEHIIFNIDHRNRQDAAEDVIRSETSRIKQPLDIKIEPHDNIGRERGSVTIDNKNYLRYNGELQICKKDLPADNRVNVVGNVCDEELFLLDYIGEGKNFCFMK